MNPLIRPGLLRNLQIGFGLSLLILIISSVASYSSIQNLLENSRLVDHTDSVITKLEYVISTLKDLETGQRGYLLTGDTVYLQPYNGSGPKALGTVDSIRELTADNPVQQKNSEELRDVITHKINIVRGTIEQKMADNIYSVDDLKKGKGYMDRAREIVYRMSMVERELLTERTIKMKKFAGYTPVLIVVAAALSVLITLVFYRRVMRDYTERSGLYEELRRKDAEISRRIDIIQGIADKISAGEYHTRVTDEEKDGLGSLAGSLNKMAESLEYSFGLLSDKEWLQGGIARLNEGIVGEMNMDDLAGKMITTVAQWSLSLVGGLYILDDRTGMLELAGSYALAQEGRRQRIRTGEGLAGQCALDGKPIVLKDIGSGEWMISFAAGDLKPAAMIAFPFFFEGRIGGVIELGSLQPYTARQLDFFDSIKENIGTAIHSMQTRVRVQELLEETQAQTEELQAQHTEMEALNSELETQAEKLQVSEEELKVQQEELQQTNEELEEKGRALEEKNHLILVRNLDIQKKAEDLAMSAKYKSEFMANMSHELRTPLNSILLLSRLLAENGEQTLSTEQIEYARVIQNSGHGLLSLIDEILDLSKIESGKLHLEYSLVPVEEILEDMRMLFVPMAKDKNLELNFVIGEGAPAQIETDKARLEQILKNLLSNAFKFTTEGHITLTIAAAAGLRNFIDFSVKDSGIGIPKEKHLLIFEAFQQADGSTRRKYGGTGLGLSISLQLAKLLGGEIGLISEPGDGSEFRVSVPQFRADQAREGTSGRGSGAGSYARPASSGSSSGSSDAGMPQLVGGPLYTLSDIPPEIPDDRDGLGPEDKLLMIVEDDTHFAKALLEFSRRKGYKGIVVVRGDAAVGMARKYKPMGILLDIQLPVKSGWEVMDDLKKDPLTRHIPVHIMSSFEAKKESLSRGAIDFMAKPMTAEKMDVVFQRIEYALHQGPKKVLIIEDNTKHAQALAYFLDNHHVQSEIAGTIEGSVRALQKDEVDCVILDMGISDAEAYETLDIIKQNPDLEKIPIIVFTSTTISKGEELRLKQFADSIVVKTAHSYQRILDEVSLFLHLVDEGSREGGKEGGREVGATRSSGRFGSIDEVLRNKTALVADDDVRNIFALTKALETHKMRVISAMDGKEAMAVIEGDALAVDIILMDMMMPEMDGYEAIARIRQNPRFKNIPIIAVTAKAMAGDREKCILAGASDYITQPVDIDQLMSLLRIWLYEK